jgi:hypothetical protein
MSGPGKSSLAQPRTARILLRQSIEGFCFALSIIASCFFLSGCRWPGGQIQQQQKFILYQVNQQALYNACAQIWQNRAIYRQNPNWHNLPPGDVSKPDINDPQIPAIVRTLNPSYIDISNARVRIECGGGAYHFGVDAFVNGNLGSGTKLLVPGLWYYSEDGAIPPK